MNLKLKPNIWRALVACFTISTFLLSSIGNTSFKLPRITNFDLLLHAIEYGLLAYLLLRWLDATDRLTPWWRTVAVTLLFCGIVGGLNELLQSQVPGRYPSVLDAIANIFGAAVVITVFQLRNLINRRSNGARCEQGNSDRQSGQRP